MATVTLKTKTNKFKKLRERITKINKEFVTYGYYSEQGEHSYAGMSYVELMAIHEYGAFNAGFGPIPPRPVFQISLNEIKSGSGNQYKIPLQNYFKRIGGDAKPVKYLDALVAKFAYKTASNFGSGKLISNTESTVDKKGFNAPLIWTGDLVANLAYSTSLDSKFKVVG